MIDNDAIDDYFDYSFDLLCRYVLAALPQDQMGHLSLLIFDESNLLLQSNCLSAYRQGLDAIFVNFIADAVT